MRSRLVDVPIYEVKGANGEFAGYTLNAGPYSATIEPRPRLQDANVSKCLVLAGFLTRREAYSYGAGVRDANGDDSTAYVTKQVEADLAVCLVPYLKGDPEITRLDYRETFDPQEATVC